MTVNVTTSPGCFMQQLVFHGMPTAVLRAGRRAPAAGRRPCVMTTCFFFSPALSAGDPGRMSLICTSGLCPSSPNRAASFLPRAAHPISPAPRRAGSGVPASAGRSGKAIRNSDGDLEVSVGLRSRQESGLGLLLVRLGVVQQQFGRSSCMKLTSPMALPSALKTGANGLAQPARRSPSPA